MKEYILPALKLMFLLFLIMMAGFAYEIDYKPTELCRESSPDGEFFVLIQEIGKPDFLSGDEHFKVSLIEKRSQAHLYSPYYRAAFQVDVPTNGGQAKAGYEVEWLEDGVQVIVQGVKKSESYYILPFKTLSE